MPLPDVAGCETDVLCAVAPGESQAIVAAYERAARMAEQLWDALERAGLGREVIAVTPTLTVELRPVVRVQFTRAGADEARWLFSEWADPPSGSDNGGGSWVA